MTQKIFSMERTSKGLKFDVNRASKQGLWFGIYKTDYSKCCDMYLTNMEAMILLRSLNKDLNIFEDRLQSKQVVNITS